MKDLGNYNCDGQMNIFDFLQQDEPEVTESVSPQEEYKESVNKQPVTKHTCMIAGVECKAHTNKGCSTPGKCGLLKEVVKENNICKYSEHECNKVELWKVADSLDETQCPHVCCRQCNIRGCGARCNGSTEPKKETKKYPNCSQDEIKYILPILRVDASENMREQVYKEIKSGMSDNDLIKCLKYYYKDWRREKGVEHEKVFNFPSDMRYHAVITYPDGMEFRRKPGDTAGCCVNTWSHTIVLIKDMIAAGDYVELPEAELNPTLIRGFTCEHDHTCWCNRYGYELPLEEYKADLIKGHSCAGCCYNCSASVMNNGKCKWDCRVKKHEKKM